MAKLRFVDANEDTLIEVGESFAFPAYPTGLAETKLLYPPFIPPAAHMGRP